MEACAKTQHPGGSFSRCYRWGVLGVVVSGLLAAGLSACGPIVVPTSAEASRVAFGGESLAVNPDLIRRETLQVGPKMPEGWPGVLPPVPGFVVGYSTVDRSANGDSMMVQFYSDLPRWNAPADYISELVAGGFVVYSADSAQRWWSLKGYGLLVEVLVDVSMDDELRIAVIVAS